MPDREAIPSLCAFRPEDYDIDYQRDYDFMGKQEVVRLRWRPKGSRGRWAKRIVIPDDDHGIGYIIDHRAEYVAAIIAHDNESGREVNGRTGTTPTSHLNARGLYEQGHLVEAARREADACDRDGYDITAAILRDLADRVEAMDE